LAPEFNNEVAVKKRNASSLKPHSPWSKVWPVLFEAAVKIAVAVIVHQLTVSPAIEILPRILQV
jgi:hypothetical protein